MTASPNETQFLRRRLGVLLAIFGVVFSLLVIRLCYLQVIQHGSLAAEATKEQSRKYEIPATRGQLYVYDGTQSTPIALNQTLEVVYADPRYVKDRAATAQKLATILGGNAQSYVTEMDNAQDYVELATRVPQAQAAQVKALGLAGIGLLDRDYRIYPEGQLAAQVLGFVNANGDGQYGIEGFLNKQLAGTPGRLAAKTDTLGLPIYSASNVIQEPKNGTNYQLTIDRNVQAEAESALQQGVQAAKAVSGSIVIMNPDNGAIIAMANYPTYNPNNYNSVSDYSVFSNDVVSNAFEPGSTMKVFDMAAGLDQNKVTPDATFNDPGSFTVDGTTIHNAATDPANGYGVTSMTRVLELSLNTGAIYVLRTLGSDVTQITQAGEQVLYNYYVKHFGFGSITGIEQTGEEAGDIPAPNASGASQVQYAEMTFGQGMTVTMIQMLAAMAAVANGGTLYQPQLLAGTLDAAGNLTPIAPKVVKRNIISSQADSQLVSMLVQTVDHGTAYIAHDQNPGYGIAGKTGTAQIPAPGGGYLVGKNIGDFLGFAPATNPKFVMMIRINEPGVGGYAETTTVPVFSQVAKWLFTYYGIAPTQ